MLKPLRVAFAGTPDFATPTLEALHASSHEVIAVLTQPDRRQGRGRQMQMSPVKACAMALGLPVLQPERLRDQGIQQSLRALSIDCLVVVAYGLLLPPEVLIIPEHGCVNIHASLLPHYRGASPMVQTILQGDAQAGVSVMAMDQGLDTGPVYRMISCQVDPRETLLSLSDKLSTLGIEALIDLLDQWAKGQEVIAKPQPSGATFAPKVHKQDAMIDWRQPAMVIDRCVRAYAGWPVAHSYLGEDCLKIHEAHVMDTVVSDEPGCLIAVGADGLDVATGQGILRITKCQWPGSRMMDVVDCWHQPRFESSSGSPLQFSSHPS